MGMTTTQIAEALLALREKCWQLDACKNCEFYSDVYKACFVSRHLWMSLEPWEWD